MPLYKGEQKVSGSSVIIDTELSMTSKNPVQNKIITQEIESLNDSLDTMEESLGSVKESLQTVGGDVETLNSKIDNKANTNDLSTVATSGSYNDLSDKPTIGTAGSLNYTWDSSNSILYFE